MRTAPILLFTYKRLDALKQTVQALKKNELANVSDLYVFSDGPKDKNDIEDINRVRQFLKTINGFKTVQINESENNKGLANSIISGVTKILEFSETVIVLEDDLLTTPNFLVYMNHALNTYTNAQKVFSISGFSFNLNSETAPSNETYFLYRGWSWGWATWKDRWNTVDWEVKDYDEFKNNKSHQTKFARGGSDLNKMLKEQMNDTIDSWAIRWFFHQFKIGGLTLYPAHSKVYNNGFDDLATHTKGSSRRYLPLMDSEFKHDFIYPKSIGVKPKYQKSFLNKMGIKARILSKIETVFISKFK